MKYKSMLFVIKGHVQGVGFRYFTGIKGKELELTGYAKNLNDGTVEVLVTGDVDNLDLMKEWLLVGPRTASVTNVTINTLEEVVECCGFEIL
ncbi:acylphosphatase [Vibrio makurazakiensis]|uniref:acylphosphatase n=1 Tax=Vibrio makurazakiensis TaxID=2910250 RepID=UPI003D126676